MLEDLYYLLAAQASRFLIYRSFSNSVSLTTLRSLHFTVQPLCDLRNAIGHQVVPT